MRSLKLGICNGSLLETTLWALSRIGIPVKSKTRRSWQKIEHELISDIFISRPANVIEYLRRGLIDCAIVGLDELIENSRYKKNDFIVAEEFSISKTRHYQHVKIVLFTSEASNIKQLSDIKPNMTVFTEYPRLTSFFFKEKGIKVKIIKSKGSTEGPVADGVYNLGVSVTETGESIKMNKLNIITEIIEAPVVLALHPKDAYTQSIYDFGAIIKGAIIIEQEYKLLKMNINAKQKEKVLALLPSLKAPTISPLADGENFAVESIVPAKSLVRLIIELGRCGATDFIWQKLEGIKF